MVQPLSLFIIAVLVYAIALVGISQPSSNRSYLPIIGLVCFIFEAFACDLVVGTVDPCTYLPLDSSSSLFMCMHVCTITLRLIPTDSQIFQSINQYTSKEFNILGGWFQNSFKLLCQAASRPFNSSSMPANSIETSGGNGGN